MSGLTRRANPEHALQVAIVKWARVHIAEPHLLLAFDRARPHTARQHLYESWRGIRAGTPDMCLVLAARACWWLELKAGDGRLSINQETLGAEIRKLGHRWEVVRSVDGLRALLAEAGIRLSPTALWAAQEADAKLAAPAAVKALAKRASKPQESRANAARIRKIEAVRRRVLF